MFSGESVQVRPIERGLVELCFDRRGDSINKLDRRTLTELEQAAAAIRAADGVKGVLITSAKSVFIVGADITEFSALFELPEPELAAANLAMTRAITAVEDLPVPTVAAINGFALGGGLELALATDLRVIADAAQVGLPEVKLGLLPGLGGTVRLPRVAGPQTALEWIVSGSHFNAAAAKAAGVVDEVASAEGLREAAISVLQNAVDGTVDWQALRAKKFVSMPVRTSAVDAVFAAATERASKLVAKHQPAAYTAVSLISDSGWRERTDAQEREAAAFARLGKTQAASSLVQIFLNDQLLKKKFRQHAESARRVQRAAVLGAGIMGGGIAYTSAVRGTPVVLKDIQPAQLDLGMTESRNLLARQVTGGRMKQERADAVLASITTQLDYAGFDNVDVVIEAVVENLQVKHKVLREVESLTRPDTVIASNTSSLRIDDLSQPLQRPEQFVGMHFFNPVPSMPLVEVIRGAKTSQAAVSTVVGYAVAMGKTPIVVQDGPGFLVNRILTPYMLAFLQLVRDGADFVHVDRVMETFGWPMGPAHLNDVIGMDTGSHVFEIICAGFPQRLRRDERDALHLLAGERRFGQKTGIGFYKYESDAKGRVSKAVAEDSHTLLAKVQPRGTRNFTDLQIIDRMMLPMIAEAAWCLEEQVAGTAAELDMALLMGLGFPQYLGGALKYADWIGTRRVVDLCDSYSGLSGNYTVPPSLRAMAATNAKFYGR
ncbi:fatty acid oxidation complex subunit alpha FadB [Steroidobacter sp.]|uniref:fatty acid oxidation complex subunit alpha FadB n=1 Tax=Steroidobacter sp. TaxID=1978227 RepID=UPI001A505205|nr:fatty acid oxidation complex subunit alpha FadB [Steroidobacter sp.]MBL8270076.1 fatty acid oxidation complex subunit alpha FadB [Steroidobacter sp.]